MLPCLLLILSPQSHNTASVLTVSECSATAVGIIEVSLAAALSGHHWFPFETPLELDEM
jgi:hypothetical protein